MQKKILPYEDRITVKENEGQSFLYVPTGIKKSSKSFILIKEAKNKASLLIKPGNIIDDWYFTGITILGDEYYFYGPAFAGMSLEEVLELGPEKGLKHIEQLIDALLLLRERGYDFFDFQTDSVYFLDNGAILFLQPELMNEIVETRSDAYELYAHEMINHPYIHSGEPCKSFTIAILLYKLLTGKFPFTATNVQEMRDKVRILDCIEPALAKPELKEDVSAVIMRALKEPETITLTDWLEYCRVWQAGGVTRRISAVEKEQITEQAQVAREKSDKQKRRIIFFEKKGQTILITGIVTAVLLAIIGSIISGFFKPRSTKGFSALQVVETFYNSMNTFEHLKMEDCVIKNAAAREVEEVMHVFLQSRLGLAHEQRSYIVPANVWDENGRPAINFPYWVFGVTNLVVEQIQQQPEPVFIASYEKWNRKIQSARPDDPITGVVFYGRKMTDRLTLTKDKDDWVIYKYERLESIPLEPQ